MPSEGAGFVPVQCHCAGKRPHQTSHGYQAEPRLKAMMDRSVQFLWDLKTLWFISDP